MIASELTTTLPLILFSILACWITMASAQPEVRATTLVIIDKNSSSGTETLSPTPSPSKPKHAPAAGSNFQSGKPYKFANIFLIGGHCDHPEVWYNKFNAAGNATLGGVTKIFCDVNGDTYTREFHLAALQEIELMTGDKLNETLVITAGVGLETDWGPVADLLRKGMAFFHAKEDNHNFHLEEFGLSPEEVLYFYFQWDERSAADRAGIEICRRRGNYAELRLGRVYVGGRNGSLNYRVDRAVDSFKVACEKTNVIEVWDMEWFGQNESFNSLRAALLFKPLPDIIFCCEDAIAEQVLNAAQEILTHEQFNRLATTGWDNIRPELLSQHKILTTVDQVTLYPHEGVWKKIATAVQVMQELGLNSTKALQDEFLLGADDQTISSDAVIVSSDRLGYLKFNILQGYDPDTPPQDEVRVSSGLLDVSITEFVPFDGKFFSVLWLKSSWHDPRLEWNPLLAEDEIPINPEEIWTPDLFFKNEATHQVLYSSPATVLYTGYITMTSSLNVELLCSTTEGQRSYPFDQYNCSFELGGPPGVILDQNYGFQLIETDPHFETVPYFDLNETGTDNLVNYWLFFKRRPFTAYVRLIIPSILINFVGFMAFWIPDVAEKVALGITALLCQLAFRDSVEMPDTSAMTWTETFVIINVFYQFVVLFIIWCSYSGKNKGSAAVNRCMRRYIHPKNLKQSVIIHEFDYLKRSISGFNGLSAVDRSKLIAELEESGLIKPQNLENLDETDWAGKASDNLPHSAPLRRRKRDNGNSELDDYWESRPSGSIHQSRSQIYNGRNSLELSETRKSRHHESIHSVKSMYDDESIDLNEMVDSGESTHAPVPRISKELEMVIQAKFPTDKVEPAKKVQEADPGSSLDWIGRWYVVPSYVIVMGTLIGHGWGFKPS